MVKVNMGLERKVEMSRESGSSMTGHKELFSVVFSCNVIWVQGMRPKI